VFSPDGWLYSGCEDFAGERSSHCQRGVLRPWPRYRARQRVRLASVTTSVPTTALRPSVGGLPVVAAGVFGFTPVPLRANTRLASPASSTNTATCCGHALEWLLIEKSSRWPPDTLGAASCGQESSLVAITPAAASSSPVRCYHPRLLAGSICCLCTTIKLQSRSRLLASERRRVHLRRWCPSVLWPSASLGIQGTSPSPVLYVIFYGVGGID